MSIQPVTSTLELVWRDIRFSLRALRKNSIYSIVAVATLALGIGANSTIFSLVNAVLFRPFPYHEPDRLVLLYENNLKHGVERQEASPANYVDWRKQQKVFDSMSAFSTLSSTLMGGESPTQVLVSHVTPEFFKVLGVTPILGRSFAPGEGSGEEKFVVIAHSLWQRYFRQDPNMIGKPLTVDYKNYTIIGVAPKEFHFPNKEVELWATPYISDTEGEERALHLVSVVARLKNGVTIQQSRANMSMIAQQLALVYPATNTNLGISVIPLIEQEVGNISLNLFILLGAVGFVLLIACANVTNLMLARSTMRQKEIAIRMAMGAKRSHLVRQMLIESFLLALLGGALGIILSHWTLKLFLFLKLNQIPRIEQVSIDGRVLGFTLLISFLTSMIFGAAPALNASKPHLAELYRESGFDTSGNYRTQRLLRLLIISEVALAVLLLIGAGLMIRTLINLQRVDPGFDPRDLMTMEVKLPYYTKEGGLPEPLMAAHFFQRLLAEINSIPGVKSAAIVNYNPVSRSGVTFQPYVQGRTYSGDAKPPLVSLRIVSPDYFKTMGISLLKGRDFNKFDYFGTPHVVIISEKMARSLFQNQNPVGMRIAEDINEGAWYSVIGVVGDVKYQGIEADSAPEIYMTYLQNPTFPMTAILRTPSDPSATVKAVRHKIEEIDKDVVLYNTTPMDQILADLLTPPRLSMFLLSALAGIALVMVSVGIYGMLSYAVLHRTSEIGVRMALGAQRKDVFLSVAGQGAFLVLIGIVIGVAAALALTRFMSSLLFGVTVMDPLTFIGTALTLIGVAFFASYLPARRATMIDPMKAIRAK